MTPCPFCKSVDLSIEKSQMSGIEANTMPDGVVPLRCWVECNDCDACGPSASSEREAIERWGMTVDVQVIDIEAERIKFEATMEVVGDGPPLERRGDGYHDQVISLYWHGWMLRAELQPIGSQWMCR